MPKLSVPLTAPQHRALKIKAAQVDLTQAEVARRLLSAWVRGDIRLPEGGEWEYTVEGYSVEHWNEEERGEYLERVVERKAGDD